MRHVADLLGQMNAPDLGILVLRSAEDDASAPAVVGDAILAEQRLRSRLESQTDETATQPEKTLPLDPLWERVETVLRVRTADTFDAPGK